MALVVGTNTYAELADIQTWLDDRGYSVTATEDAVFRAMDYIESMPWMYDREDEDSDLWWGDSPPQAVINALCQAVRIEVTTPNSLLTSGDQRIKKEKIDIMEIEYESGGYKKIYPTVTQYLKGLIMPVNSLNLELH